jgi:hypothetical protein
MIPRKRNGRKQTIHFRRLKMTNIYILGTSRSGKTPVAKMLTDKLGMQWIGGSEWVREEYKEKHATRKEFIAGITKYSVERLREEPDVCVKYITSKYDLSQPSVIDGERNPYDFIQLFNPTKDKVVYLDFVNNFLEPTIFEDGIKVIDKYLRWNIDNGLMDEGQYKRYEFDCLYEYEKPCGGAVSLDYLMNQILEDMQNDT